MLHYFFIFQTFGLSWKSIRPSSERAGSKKAAKLFFRRRSTRSWSTTRCFAGHSRFCLTTQRICSTGIWNLDSWLSIFFYYPLSYCQTCPSPHQLAFMTGAWLPGGFNYWSPLTFTYTKRSEYDEGRAGLSNIYSRDMTWERLQWCYSKNEDNLMFDHTSLVF